MWGIFNPEGKMMRNLFILAILFFAASVAFAQDKRFNVPLEDSPASGAADAPVTIIEFLDFQ